MFLRRWSLRSKALTVFALAAGAGTFGLVRGYAAELEALRPATQDRVPVVVAAAALPRGSVLEPETLSLQQVPSAYAPPGAFGSIERAAGRILAADIAEGEAVTQTRVGGGGGRVASLVVSGLRGFVVPSGLPPGILEPGDLVDVIATFGGPRPYTDTVGSGLEVLAVVEDDGGAFEAGGSSGTSLVLLVSQTTAEQLAHATAFGTVTVTVAPFQPPTG